MPEHTLYVAPASAPCRAVLLHHHLIGASAPELGLVHVDLMAGEHQTDEFKRHNPLHCVPTLVTPWGPIWESRAIMRYLESIIPDPLLYPTGVFHRAVVDRLLDWDLGSLYRVVSSIVYSQIFAGKEPATEDLEKLDAATRFLDQQQLGDGRAFLTGSTLTIADVSCAMTLSLLRLVDLEIDDVPRMAAWQNAVANLPGYDQVDAPFQSWIDSFPKKEAVESASPPPGMADKLEPEAKSDASASPKDGATESTEASDPHQPGAADQAGESATERAGDAA